MVREAEIGRGTSINEHVDNPGPVDVVPEDDPTISYIFSRIGEENISCGCDEEFITSMPEQILEFYLAYISVSLQDIQEVYFKTLGQNNFIWRKERQVSCSSENSNPYHKYYVLICDVNFSKFNSATFPIDKSCVYHSYSKF